MTGPILQFRGEYRFLSNFYPSPLEIRLGDETFAMPSVENAYQAAKIRPQDPDRIRLTRSFVSLTAGEAKRKGKSLKLREDWDQIRITVMHLLLRQKFSLPNLRALLLLTGDRMLVEGNSWGDRFWGVDLTTNVGENHLGKLLMKVREEIQ